MPAPPTSRGRRLLHRLPVRVRHYWKLLAGCAALVVVLTVVVSTVRVQPYVTSRGDRAGDEVIQDIAGTTELFDATTAHTVTITFRDENYQRMLDTYYAEGEKEYVEADLTVDGTVIPSVGIRLKGNSTLGGLTRNGQARQGGRGGPGGRGGRTGLKAEEPETLPWLIRFDEFVEGRRYQGHREVAVRVAGMGGGMGGGTTVLNEALALNLLARTGEPAPRYAYSSFMVNGRPTTARLLVEHPDERFADDLGGSGVLYKSLATGRFADQGDDPTAYADDFAQITGKGSQDLQPVIDLVQWVEHSTDAEFAGQLAEHVDVASFARYVAWQNLLLNFDDMAGPGRNYYLWYDLDTAKFSVIGWDYNLTFSGDTAQGPHDAGGMGRFPGGGQPPEGMRLPEGMAPPEGMRRPEGMELPDGMRPPGEMPGPGGRTDGEDGAGARGGGFGGGHELKERFLAATAFRDVYEDAYRELYQAVYGSGTALKAIGEITAVLGAVGGRNEQAITDDAGRLRTLIEQRTTALAADEVITAG
jgi:spore coat protein CotH